MGHVQYINILTWLRGFQDKRLYLVVFSFVSQLPKKKPPNINNYSKANNCFSIIFRGEYKGLQINGPKHKNTDVTVRVHTRMQP